LKDDVIDMVYPVWVRILIGILIVSPIVPIIGFLVVDLYQNPKDWARGFKNRLCNRIEYYPDPSCYDPTRRRNIAEHFPQEVQDYTAETATDQV